MGSFRTIRSGALKPAKSPRCLCASGGFLSHALFDLQCNQLQGLVHRYRRQASSHIDRVQQELFGLGLALLDDIHQALGQCRVVFVEVMATR